MSSTRRSSQFNPAWEKELLVWEYCNGAQCLVCNTVFSYLKKSNLERHYKNSHAAEYERLSNEERELFVKQKKEERDKESNEDVAKPENIIRISYKTTLRLVRAGLPFSSSEVVKGVVQDFVSELDPTLLPMVDSVPLSRKTMTRRTPDMANDLTDQLKDLVQTFEVYSIALDESTDVSNTAQMAIFIRGVDGNLKVTEEFLDLVPMKDTTTGQDIFDSVDETLKRFELTYSKLKSATTDGAPAMTGKNAGFRGCLERRMATEDLVFLPIHCLVHQENLVAKSLVTGETMKVVVTTTNSVLAHGLNHRQFKSFLDDLNCEYSDLTYFSDVRWLSRGKLLQRFFHLAAVIDLFMNMKRKPIPQLSDPNFLTNLAFLTDITGHLNKLNVQLQGRDTLITTLLDYIEAFKIKLKLWISQLRANKFSNFELLATRKDDLTPERVERYVEILDSLLTHFNNYFQINDAFQKEMRIFRLPFSNDIDLDSISGDLQCELAEFRCDLEIKDKYDRRKDLLQFYENFPRSRFPKLHTNAAKILCIFGTTYLCEQCFSIMNATKSKRRGRLTDTNLSALLRIKTSRSIVPRIQKLAQKKR